MQVRYRIDGVLKEVNRLPRNVIGALVSRIKILANLKIDERRVPQDGRFKIKVAGKQYALRVSSMPVSDGEKIAMRILDESDQAVSLESLGYWGVSLKVIKLALTEPNGMVLVTGPTGSGKSTSLFSVLSILNTPDVNIATIEDPVEYKIPGVNQTQTNTKAGMTFANGLRALLRQDPNIILVGEIRDYEVADVAMAAALTGHLVFSTLHTNDAPSAITRLLDMGVEPFLVASAVRAVQAQRLVRKLCDQCAIPGTPSQSLIETTERIKSRAPNLFDGQPRWRVARGCPECRGSGYRGRLGIYEFLEVTPQIQEAIMRQEPATEMLKIAQQQGYRNLREDGLIKAWRGFTSTDEVLRVTGLSEGVEIL